MNTLKRLIPILAVALAATAACRDGTTAVTNGVVTVAREGDALRIRNSGSQARGFAVYDAGWLAAANVQDFSLLALCNTPDVACLRLPAYGSVLVPLSDIGGYSASTTDINVFTWRVLPVGENVGYQAVADETIQLKL